MLKIYHIQRVARDWLFPECIPCYRYVSLLEDREYLLTEADYSRCVEEFYQGLPIMEQFKDA
jgi:hypothetical protein